MGSMGHGPQARVGMPVTPCWMELRAVGFVPACSSSLGCPSCLSQCVRLVSHSHLPWLHPSEKAAVCVLRQSSLLSVFLYSSPSGSTQISWFCYSAWGFTSLQGRMVLVTRCGWWPDWTVWWTESLSWELLLWWNPSFSISIASFFLKNTAVIFREKTILIHLL